MDRFIEFGLNHYMLILAWLVVSYLLVQEFFDAAFKRYGYVSPMVAVTKMNSGNVVVIDVREHEDFNKGHIENAINLPLSKLKENSHSLDAYKNNETLIICQDGTRSNSAGKIITKAGIKDAFVITGGMTAWQDDYRYPIKIGKKA